MVVRTRERPDLEICLSTHCKTVALERLFICLNSTREFNELAPNFSSISVNQYFKKSNIYYNLKYTVIRKSYEIIKEHPRLVLTVPFNCWPMEGIDSSASLFFSIKQENKNFHPFHFWFHDSELAINIIISLFT